MSEDNYRGLLVQFIREQARPPDKFSHQARLYLLAVKIAGEEAFDDDVLFASAWLHDLGVFVGHRPEDPALLARWDNVAYAVKEAPGLLRRVGFPESKVGSVCECISTHLPSGSPDSFEGLLLRDADILEQLGAVGILRTVSKVGRDTRFPRFADAVAVLKRNLEGLPRQFRLESARRLAKPRLEALRQFLEAVQAEAGATEL